MAKTPVYITTPIYYVNDKPHIGHVYTTTVCDVYARWSRFTGKDVFFLTGTDEHGVKVEKAAIANGESPLALADRNAAEFQRVLPVFGITNDDFIRTTQPRHTAQVQAFVKRLIDQGDVYLGKYEGWYDEGQEEFVPETRAAAQQYKSAVSGKPLVRTTESNYFFRLSAYQQRLEKLYADQPGFVRPEARRNEMTARFRDGLADIPVSRTSFSWGIPVPASPDGQKHVLWVWLDALSNYITALGLGDPQSPAWGGRHHYWPAQYHVIGKEILFFHALFWPAMLMALDLPLPRCIYAHSFWVRDGQKMSKSLGNFLDLPTISGFIERYGLDAWRYYMVTQGPLGATDANFAADHYHEVYTAHLVNTVGNCASRVTAMIGKYFDSAVPVPAEGDKGGVGAKVDWPAVTRQHVAEFGMAMAALDLGSAAESAMSLLRRIDLFINETEPFKVAKDAARRDELATILFNCVEGVRIASVMLWPVMPAKMEQLWKALGQTITPNAGAFEQLVQWGGPGAMRPGTKVEKVALFPRVDPPIVE